MGSFKLPSTMHVTSIDICRQKFVIVGCDNGDVLCFTIDFHSKRYVVIGQLTSKLFSNIQTIVKVSEDGKYCFAGTRKGSSEALGLNLENFLRRSDEAFPPTKELVKALVPCYKHRDHKLRGFGGATRMVSDNTTTSTDKAEYRLVCGLGIKNLHVWSFIPLNQSSEAAEWSCIYDIVTNGITIECAEFLNGGLEVMSKSAGANIRVWQIGSSDIQDPKSRPAFEDISNTQDARAMFKKYAYGGTYDLSVVKFGATKDLNRDEIHVPSKATADADPNKRKRKLREIESIVGMSEGEQILLLCTDGGVLFYDTTSNCQGDTADFSKPSVNGSTITELESLQYNPDIDMAWTLGRLGPTSDLTLLRAIKRDHDSYLETSLISDIIACEEPTAVLTECVALEKDETIFPVEKIAATSLSALSAQKTPSAKLNVVSAAKKSTVEAKRVPSAARPPLRNVTNTISNSQSASKVLDSLFSAVDDGSVTATKKLKSGAVAVEEAILKRSRRDADLPAVPAVSFLRQVVDIPKFSKNALSETPAPRVRRLEVYVDTALNLIPSVCSGIEISLVDWTRKCEAHLSAWRKDVINAIVASPVYGTHAVDHISRSCDSQCQIVLRCVETIVRLKPLSKPSSLQTLLDSCELLIKDQVQQDSVALRAVAWRDSTLQVPNYVKWELNSIPMVSLLEVRESLLKLY